MVGRAGGGVDEGADGAVEWWPCRSWPWPWGWRRTSSAPSCSCRFCSFGWDLGSAFGPFCCVFSAASASSGTSAACPVFPPLGTGGRRRRGPRRAVDRRWPGRIRSGSGSDVPRLASYRRCQPPPRHQVSPAMPEKGVTGDTRSRHPGLAPPGGLQGGLQRLTSSSPNPTGFLRSPLLRPVGYRRRGVTAPGQSGPLRCQHRTRPGRRARGRRKHASRRRRSAVPFGAGLARGVHQRR